MTLNDQIRLCHKCDLRKTICGLSPIPGDGNGKVVWLKDKPEEFSTLKTIERHILNLIIEQCGIKDIFCTTLIKCPATFNKKHIEQCRGWFDLQMSYLQPDLIMVSLGIIKYFGKYNKLDEFHDKYNYLATPSLGWLVNNMKYISKVSSKIKEILERKNKI